MKYRLLRKPSFNYMAGTLLMLMAFALFITCMRGKTRVHRTMISVQVQAHAGAGVRAW